MLSQLSGTNSKKTTKWESLRNWPPLSPAKPQAIKLARSFVFRPRLCWLTHLALFVFSRGVDHARRKCGHHPPEVTIHSPAGAAPTTAGKYPLPSGDPRDLCFVSMGPCLFNSITKETWELPPNLWNSRRIVAWNNKRPSALKQKF